MIKNTHLYNIVFSRDDYMEVLMKLENHQDSIYPVKAKKVISRAKKKTTARRAGYWLMVSEAKALI